MTYLDPMVVSEAQLRGIDMKALYAESFTTLEHIKMVKSHEAKAQLLRELKLMRNSHRPAEPAPAAPKPPKQKSVPRARLKDKRVFFTEAQLNIAKRAMEGKK